MEQYWHDLKGANKTRNKTMVRKRRRCHGCDPPKYNKSAAFYLPFSFSLRFQAHFEKMTLNAQLMQGR